jgi:hypothetical protein
VTNSKNWSNFGEATVTYRKRNLDGIGFVLGDGLAGVDLDDCRDPKSGVLEDWARDIVDELDSYTEISPSGTGVKIFLRGELPPGVREKKGSIEIYTRGKYFTVTGHHLPGTPTSLEARQDALVALHGRVFGPAVERRDLPEGPLHDLSDDDIIKMASIAKNGSEFRRLWEGDWSGYSSQSEADQALFGQLAFWTGNDADRLVRLFRRSGLAGREKADRDDYASGTAEKAIRGQTAFYRATSNSANRFSQDLTSSPKKETHSRSVDLEAGKVVGEKIASRVAVQQGEPRQGGQGDAMRAIELALDLAGRDIPEYRRPFDLARRLRTMSAEDPFQFEPAVRAFAERTGDDPETFWLSFYDVWDRILKPEGDDPLAMAAGEADRTPYTPSPCVSPIYAKFASIAWHLALIRGEEPIFLPQARLAELLDTSQRTVSTIISIARKHRLIEVVDGTYDSRTGKAMTYRWIGGDAPPAEAA